MAEKFKRKLLRFLSEMKFPHQMNSVQVKVCQFSGLFIYKKRYSKSPLTKEVLKQEIFKPTVDKLQADLSVSKEVIL